MSAVPASNGFLVAEGALSRDSLQPTSTVQPQNGSAIGAGRVHHAAAAALPSSAPVTALSIMMGSASHASTADTTPSSVDGSEALTLEELPGDSPRTIMSKRMAKLPPCLGIPTPGATASSGAIHVAGRPRRHHAVTSALPVDGALSAVVPAALKPQALPPAPVLSLGDQIVNGFKSIFRCKCSS